MNSAALHYLAAALGGFLCAWLSLPVWRRLARRLNLVDDPGHRKIHSVPTPLAGGLAVLTGLLVPLLVAVAAAAVNPALEAFDYGFGRRAIQLTGIVGGAIGMLLLGLMDDRFELRPAVKFSGQFLIAALVAATGTRIDLFVDNPLFSYGVTVFWILTITNAMNFMDNMNGLCGGIGAIGATGFGLHAALRGHYLVAALAFLVAGAIAGFLPHNFPRATAFLGDSGSHLVGYLLAVLAISPHFYTPETSRPVAVLSPLLVLVVPLADLAQVVALRTLHRKPFWIGDTNHLSHRLVRAGFSKPKAVALLWLAALAGGMASLFL
jgi:UDP-GlcNAc:undecaprenyl-phosphate GlcNAc-1-phosphate transferase